MTWEGRILKESNSKFLTCFPLSNFQNPVNTQAFQLYGNYKYCCSHDSDAWGLTLKWGVCKKVRNVSEGTRRERGNSGLCGDCKYEMQATGRISKDSIKSTGTLSQEEEELVRGERDVTLTVQSRLCLVCVLCSIQVFVCRPGCALVEARSQCGLVQLCPSPPLSSGLETRSRQLGCSN